MEQGNFLHRKHGLNLPQHQYSGYHRSKKHPGWREEERLQPQRHESLARQRSTHNQNAQPLPPGWVEATDSNSGKIYYCNPQTRETKWERPTTTISNTVVPATTLSRTSLVMTGNLSSHYQRQQQQQGLLPPGWVEAVDQRSGKNYFCNPQTRETKWERPASIPSTHSATYAESNTYSDAHGNLSKVKVEHSSRSSETLINTSIANPESNQSISPSMMASATRKNNYGDDVDFDELSALTGGQIAYSIKQQQRQEHETKNPEISSRGKKIPSNYVPLQISLISSISTTERTEPGRLDVRMYALREELKNFGSIQSSTQESHLMQSKSI